MARHIVDREKSYPSSLASDSLRHGPGRQSYDSRSSSQRDYVYPPEADFESVYERPTGIRGLYYHPATQVALLGFVCFMGPGLFNALNGLGAGGQLDSATNSNANTALYSTFAVMAFFAGSINNILGPRLTLLLGSMGYSLYIGSYLAMNIHRQSGPFVVAAGAILGVSAGLLWTAQGSLMMAYPTEADKGKYIAIFWAIFNIGGVVGAAVAAGKNWNSTAGTVDNGTYICFLILTCIGVVIPMAMADPEKMLRSDGTRVAVQRQRSWKSEIKGLWVTLRTDPFILLLFPMFFASNYFYTWQFSGFNGAIFTIRARGLNNLLYWVSQIIGCLSMAMLLDQRSLSRKARAYLGWAVLFLTVFAVHTWGYFYQRQYTRQSAKADIDIFDKRYIGRVFFYVSCGLMDSMWQTTSYWLMGAMSNDPAKLAFFAGFYKSIQSAGGAGIWRADATKTPYLNMYLSTWAILVAGLLAALPMVFIRVKNHTGLDDEALARMDEDGHVMSTQEAVAKGQGQI
ncbi:MFS general substrate transporter [Cylindrobasidium torrendii FP15055 ss-10]|uniref:MFS general substrate transporter n=1 Tax=Cylindrobasidium torrendii FP15055 ss-10 TaxID=1314674 RepID=A0A0D7BPH1_9AGAR|nr:MFS general substrate transporter [Cylindrobasidium torrendii FP15055 ss-10]